MRKKFLLCTSFEFSKKKEVNTNMVCLNTVLFCCQIPSSSPSWGSLGTQFVFFQTWPRLTLGASIASLFGTTDWTQYSNLVRAPIPSFTSGPLHASCRHVPCLLSTGWLPTIITQISQPKFSSFDPFYPYSLNTLGNAKMLTLSVRAAVNGMLLAPNFVFCPILFPPLPHPSCTPQHDKFDLTISSLQHF